MKQPTIKVAPWVHLREVNFIRQSTSQRLPILGEIEVENKKFAIEWDGVSKKIIVTEI